MRNLLMTMATAGLLLLPLISGQTVTKPTVLGAHSCTAQVWVQQAGIAPAISYWQTWQLWSRPCPTFQWLDFRQRSWYTIAVEKVAPSPEPGERIPGGIGAVVSDARYTCLVTGWAVTEWSQWSAALKDTILTGWTADWYLSQNIPQFGEWEYLSQNLPQCGGDK